jgi:hypothetical protein
VLLEVAPEEQAKPERAAPAQPAAASRALGALGHRPTLTDLQRAVILAEVIRRHDFQSLPIDRELL